MRRSRVLIYIEAARGYYARYIERSCTHKHVTEPGANIEPYWIEMLRTAPETWDTPTEPEAA